MLGSRYKNHTGKRYGRLTPLRKIGTRHDCALWLCGCYCGNYTEKATSEFARSKNPRTSCGYCLDHVRYPKEYIAWRNIKARCTNKDDKSYSEYGAKGIDMCVEWRLDFLDFLLHIGLAPTPDHTIDRIDSTKNYEPGNVRWATRSIQNLNKSNITHLRSLNKLQRLLESEGLADPIPKIEYSQEVKDKLNALKLKLTRGA